MGWDGWFEYGGNEVINAERTEKYLNDAAVPWFRPQFRTTVIGELLEETYESPLLDPAPWIDPDEPDSFNFYGLYPLRVQGIEDSTRSAVVTENIGDGGAIGNVRHATRSVVFEALLLGKNECANEAGMRWLKAALLGSVCVDSCAGESLCYFACEPCLPPGCPDTPEEHTKCLVANQRSLRNAKVISGPTVTAKRKACSDGGAIWAVTFTVVSGIPNEFSPELPLVSGFMSGTDPWVPSVVPADWLYDDVGDESGEELCPVTVFEPLVDPSCPAIISPPSPPSLAQNCYAPLDEWTRRWFTIPAEYVPYWGDVVPILRIASNADAIRPMRIRFYPDPLGDGSGKDDYCSFCADIVVSYLPPSHILTIDGASQTLYADGPAGSRRRADALVFANDGTPMEWPELTCGTGYVVTVDLDPDVVDLPQMDLALVTKGLA
jgi:hypothetical protein